MSKKQFDTYRFSVKTEVKFADKWYPCYGVDFGKRIVLVGLYWMDCEEIDDIRN